MSLLPEAIVANISLRPMDASGLTSSSNFRTLNMTNTNYCNEHNSSGNFLNSVSICLSYSSKMSLDISAAECVLIWLKVRLGNCLSMYSSMMRTCSLSTSCFMESFLFLSLYFYSSCRYSYIFLWIDSISYIILPWYSNHFMNTLENRLTSPNRSVTLNRNMSSPKLSKATLLRRWDTPVNSLSGMQELRQEHFYIEKLKIQRERVSIW